MSVDLDISLAWPVQVSKTTERRFPSWLSPSIEEDATTLPACNCRRCPLNVSTTRHFHGRDEVRVAVRVSYDHAAASDLIFKNACLLARRWRQASRSVEFWSIPFVCFDTCLYTLTWHSHCDVDWLHNARLNLRLCTDRGRNSIQLFGLDFHVLPPSGQPTGKLPQFSVHILDRPKESSYNCSSYREIQFGTSSTTCVCPGPTATTFVCV